MINKLGVFLIFCCVAIKPAVAQLPSGATAPDFNVQDINGQYHHLYNILSQNKMVVLEISATWCPPCWSYHQSHALQDLYAAHGPSGDNKLEVLWVEGDPNTNQACIFGQTGCNNNSQGNFADGTLYPILNNSVIPGLYQINYFPTIFVICPNKRVYEVDPVSAGVLWDKAQVCPVAYGANNAGIYAHDPGYDLPEICETVKLAPSFLLTNLGSEPLTSASIFLKWNGANVQTIEWTGNLSTYGEDAIKFDSFPVNDQGELNTVIASINNNVGDEDFTNNYKNNQYVTSKHFSQTKVVLKIRTDDYGRETYWELHDDLGNVLDHGGNQLVGIDGGGGFPLGVDVGPGSYSNNTLIKDTLELPGAGCYSIHFVDAYGDGMCCAYGNGYYKLYNIDNPATPLISSGQYEAYDSHAFEAGGLSSGTETAVQNLDIRLFPNPASDILFIDFGSIDAGALRLAVLNAMGQQVLTPRTAQVLPGDNTLEIPLENLSDGMYFLSASHGEGMGLPSVFKFVVKR